MPEKELRRVAERPTRQEILDRDGTRAEVALRDLLALDIARHDHELLLPRMWELREHMTAYDGAYIALAEVLDAPLLTLDGRLARSPGHTATVELVGASPT